MAQEGRNREQEETGCQQPAGHVLCANNCGLFGSEATLNFCSKCYQEVVLRKAKAFTSTIFPLDEKPLSSMTEEEEKSMNEAQMACSREISSAFRSIASCLERHQNVKAPNRCSNCRKRVGLTGFKCRCGDLFCAVHRYSDKHNCSFDYKAAARHDIAKANPVIKADKIQRI